MQTSVAAEYSVRPIRTAWQTAGQTARASAIGISVLFLSAVSLCHTAEALPIHRSDPAAATAKPDSSAPVSPTPDSNNNSPFDYRSSEKISEDLSVSFPVDI